MLRQSHASALLRHLYQVLQFNQRRLHTGPLLRRSRGAMADDLESRTLLSTITYTVTSTVDSGPGTLRDAIIQANTDAGPGRITFDIAGTGIQIIKPVSPLPQITDELEIDGSTQPGYAGASDVAAAPVVFIDGRSLDRDPNFNLDGLKAAATLNLKAIGIAGFEHNVYLGTGSDWSSITGCYIGVDPTGELDWQVREDAIVSGVDVSAPHATIGGSTADARNVIAGSGYAIEAYAAYDRSHTTVLSQPDYLAVQGNYIGTNAEGTALVGTRASVDGISGVGTITLGLATHVTVGGSTPAAANIIAGDLSAPISVWGMYESIIAGNNIQVAPDGVTPIPAVAPPLGGIEVDGSDTSGNWISDNVIGGVAGNGIFFDMGANRNTVQGNYIGVDRSCTVNLGRADTFSGIYFADASANNAIDNIIGFFRRGIRIGYPWAWKSDDNIVQGNYIGVGPGGQDIGNNGPGILVGWGDGNNIGVGASEFGGNTIANNGRSPIAGEPVGGVVVQLGASNTIRGNSIHDNAGAGIDLGGDGANANDYMDVDDGANNRQNYPTIDNVAASAGHDQLYINASLQSSANTTFTIDFYAAESSANGGQWQGRSYIGSTTVITDTDGNASIFLAAPWLFSVPHVVATATDNGTSGSTSEFSFEGTPTPSLPNITVNDITVSEGNSGQTAATFTLTLDRASDQTIWVNVNTIDNTATAPDDYDAMANYISFAPGTTSQTATVYVNGDSAIESDETFYLYLSSNVNAAIADDLGIATIVNDDIASSLDPGNTLTTATRLGNGGEDPSTPISEQIDSGTDVDLYYFIVQAGTTAVFTIDSGGSGLDSYLRLFDHSGNELAANDDWNGLDSQITYTFTETGTYYIGVSGLSNTSYIPVDGSNATWGTTGGYILYTAGLPMQDVVGDYDRFSDAWLIDNGQPLRTTISSAGDYDLYHISINPGDSLTCRFSTDAAFGTTLKIFDASGTELYNSSADAGYSGQTVFTFSGPGDYYVGISGQGNDTYNPNESLPTTLPGSQGDYTFTMQGNRRPTDISLSIANIAENQPSGTVVGLLSGTDPDAGQSATLTFTLLSGYGDNARFSIDPATRELKTAEAFDFEAKSSYVIEVRTTDTGGLIFDKVFTISVINVAEVVPTITGISTDSGSSSSDGITSDSTLLINGTSEPGMTVTVYRGGVLAGTTSANGSGNWVFDYTGTSFGDGSYNFTATASDTLGDTTAASAPYAVTIDTIAPELPTSSINDGAVQRSMVKKLTLSFGEKVVLGTGAVTVKKSDGSDVPDTTLLVTNPSGDQRNYVLSFSGIGVVGGSLADGIYDLSVAAAGVHDLAGNALGGNFSQRFHRLYGDYDGNKTVNNGDYFWFKQTFNKNTGDTGFLDLCDYDANGTVNNGDYFQFKKRFGVVYTY